MNNNILVSALKIISMDEKDQIGYIKTILDDDNYENIDEILLGYDNAKFLRDDYSSNVELENMFKELEKVIDEIEDKHLFFIKYLNEPLWNEARIKAKKILQSI